MLIGHQKQWQILKKSADLKSLPHGLLFYGQDQLGKKTFAIEFVKYLNCQNKQKKPCQICRNCRDIEKGVYPDLITLEPAHSAREIQISQIRNLVEKLSLRPYSADFKTAILDKAHLMNQQAQSCFLKFLEEPRGNVLLILISEYPESLLPTIISRVQKIRFSPLTIKEIEEYLLKKGISETKAKHLAAFSFGKPGRMFNFISDPKKIEEQEGFISDLVKIINSDLVFRFKYAKSLSEIKNLREVLDVWLRYFRGVFLSRLKEKKNGLFIQYSLSKLKKIIELIQTTEYLIFSTNINSKLALEILLMEL